MLLLSGNEGISGQYWDDEIKHTTDVAEDVLLFANYFPGDQTNGIIIE